MFQKKKDSSSRPLSHKPIFFDINKKRWPKIKTGVYIFGFFGTLMVSLVVGSIFVNPFLDALSLKSLDILPKKQNLSPQFHISKNTSVFKKTKKTLLNQIAQQNKKSKFITKTKTAQSLRVGFFVDWDDASLSSLKDNLSSLDIVIGEWMHLSDSQGNITPDNPDREKIAIDFIKSRSPDVKILGLINNFTDLTWQAKNIADSINTPEKRQKIDDTILEHLKVNGLSGVSIDFENIPLSAQNNYVLFLEELSSILHKNNYIITVNLPANDNNFQYANISKIVDYVVLMAYDEHWTTSTPGAIASINWFNTILESHSQDIPSEKMIIALGNYAYDWTKGTTEGVVRTYEEAMLVAKESEGDIIMDPDSLNPVYDYYDENNAYHQVWMMDATTTFNCMKEGAGYYPAGFALWRLGSEDPTIWNYFGEDVSWSTKLDNDLEAIHFNYNLDYEGQGEILQVTSSPQVGKRTITYDTSLQLITDLKYLTYPAPYIINRYGGADKKKIALTFDDGPDPTWTTKVLDELKKAGVHATFFVIGKNAEANPNILKREYAEGNDIGNHTFTHPNITDISQGQLQLELTTTERLLEGFIGRYTRLFRPPYSEDSEPDTQEQAAAVQNINNLGYIIVGMKVDPNDWKSPGIQEIVDATVSQVEAGKGNIILLHDAGGDRSQTVQALPLIIQKLQERGYEFVTLSGLMGKTQGEIMPPTKNMYTFWSDKIGFNSLHLWTYFLNLIFILGILLGIGRLLFVIILALWHKWSQKRIFQSTDLSVAVIIPAYNEGKVILTTLASLLASNHSQKFEIIVVDDGSTDDTYGIVQKFYGDDSRIKTFQIENGGKPNALNFGITQTRADIIITLDADTIFSQDTISRLVRHFDDSQIGAVAGNAKVGNRINLLTRWQAIEYITSQNLDRRAFAVLNCITVVPGAVGAWRRDVVISAGGFSGDTLAEDSDLTIAIQKKGYLISYDESAYGITEAPDTVNAFVRQRYRWMFGTFQAVWKHKDAAFRPQYGWLGMFALPNIFLYQIVFPLISPIIDGVALISILSALLDSLMHGSSYVSGNLKQILFYYSLFLIVDYATGLIAFLFEKKEDKKLLVWLFSQRFFYRQLIYVVAIKTLLASLKGHEVGWNKLERKATVKFDR